MNDCTPVDSRVGHSSGDAQVSGNGSCHLPEHGSRSPTLIAPSTGELAQLGACVERLDSLGVTAAGEISDLRQKIASQRFDLVVAGQFKRGKTSLINALVGADLLPVAVVPLTSIVTGLTYGSKPAAAVLFETGENKDIPLTELSEYVTERGNPGNHKGVREALVAYPSPWLSAGIRLVDTPGVGSVYQKNTDVTYRFLPRADAVLFVLSVDQPISQAESDFLGNVREYSDKILFILNKADLLSEAELAESLEFTRSTLANILGGSPQLFPLSARLALTARKERSEKLLATSGMPELTQALDEFLEKEKGAVLAASVARQARRVVSLARFDLQVEFQSLNAPLEELEHKSRLFQEKKRELTLARNEIAMLLGKDASRALLGPLEEDLAEFAKELKQRAIATIERRLNELSGVALRELHACLERDVIDEIQKGFDSWRAGESAAMDKTLDAFCARHAEKIDAAIDELFRFSSNLFAIPFTPLRAGSFHRIESHFYYKFWSEPAGVTTLISSILFALPRAIGARPVVNSVLRYALESVDMQSGRTRYDFSQRLDKALIAFKRELEDKTDAAIAGIETAMEKARNLRTAGEAAIQDRRITIVSTLRSLDEIDGQIGMP